MSWDPETPDAGSGLTKAIYQQLDAQLAGPLRAAVAAATTDEQRATAADILQKTLDAYRKLAYAIASSTRDHVIGQLEVYGVLTTGSISATVDRGVATQDGVVFTQSNDGTGRLR